MKKKYQKDNVLYYKKEKNHVQDLILPGETRGNESKYLTENVDIFSIQKSLGDNSHNILTCLQFIYAICNAKSP